MRLLGASLQGGKKDHSVCSYQCRAKQMTGLNCMKGGFCPGSRLMSRKGFSVCVFACENVCVASLYLDHRSQTPMCGFFFNLAFGSWLGITPAQWANVHHSGGS